MDKFKKAFKNGANIGYLVAGYPSLEYTKEFLNTLDNSALDLLEIGIPYSDPIADGPAIRDASFEAVNSGVNARAVFHMLGSVKTTKCLVFLVYYNTIFSYGEDKFIADCAKVGISGLIIPDLPFEENCSLAKKCAKLGIALVPLISVTTGHRAKKILKHASGFVYMIASLGVTGSKQSPEDRLKELAKNIKKISSLPVAVGFGVRSNEDVKRLRSFCDGVIMGTVLVEASKNKSVSELNALISELFA